MITADTAQPSAELN